MKKQIIALAVAALLLSSCGIYTKKLFKIY